MKVLWSPLTGRYYAVGDNYKPGQKKHDVTESVERIIAAAINRYELKQIEATEAEMDENDRLSHPETPTPEAGT